mgnify:CR=1 FL=1
MKICFLSKDYSYNGGGERMLCNLANELSCFCKVTVVSFDFSEKKSIYKLNSEIKFIDAKVQRRKINFFTKFDYVKYILSHSDFFDSFDFIIGVGIICSLVLSYCSPKLKAKTVGWEHFCYDGTPFYQKVLRKLIFKNLSQVVILTKRDLEKYKKINQNTRVIYNFTNMEFRKFPNFQNRQFLFVGRLSKQKGFFDLCKIMKKFCKKNADWNFRIIGNGEYKANFEKFIKSENLENRIKWSLISDDIQTEMENTSCLLMTSNFEGLPMVLIEAGVCALPAISYDTPTGPSDIISDSKSGFIVPIHNQRLFVERMLQFVGDSELQQKLSAGAKTKNEKFFKQNILCQWKEILK